MNETTCPNHPNLDPQATKVLTDSKKGEYLAFSLCGCYSFDLETFERHSFRFFPGDKVRHATWKGFTGVIERGTPHIYVKWNPILGPGVTPTAFPSNFDITHLEG